MVFSLQISRQFFTTSILMLRRLTKRSNPGLGYQVTEIEEVAKVIQSDPEGFEGLESDLFNANKSHKQHEFDIHHQKEKIRQYIVKRKYFRKESLPNLLTYAEKEQIKFLHSSDNEEWTVEKLAESFPASAETICKILKARWSPMSTKRIFSHDAGVFRNWQRFENGEYSTIINTELFEHLKKFVNRDAKDINILQDPTQTFQKKQWQKPKSNEFSSIILSLRPKTDDNKNITLSDGKLKEKTVLTNSTDKETYLLGEIKNKKPMTIHEVKAKYESENPKSINKTFQHQLATQKLKNISGTGIIREKNNCALNAIAATDYTDKFASDEVVINEVDRKRYGMSTSKERVHIPRKLWRKGATYRANDCYYDDDGEFLYRVPGMTSQ